MLAGLVLASFTVVPPSRAPAIAAPTIQDEPASARVAPMSRGLVRGLRMADDLEVTDFDGATTASSEAPAVAAVSAPEPLPEPAPERTPPPTPRPTPLPVAWLTNRTTLWAEGRMLELINASRVRGGLVPLAMDIAVADTARAHSGAEAAVRYVYHDGSDGTAKTRNVRACGTGWYGENTGKIWNDNVDALHIEFMAEPWEPINHRTNIMDPAFVRVGIGAVMGPDAIYMTMVFCR